MKKILLITFISFISIKIVFATTPAADIQIGINTQTKFYNELLKPLWKNIPYDYSWLTVRNEGQEYGRSITFQVIDGHLNVGPKGTALAKVVSQNSNKMLLNWNFSKMNIHSKIRVRFQFKKFGITLTHHEVFLVKASDIPAAKTKISLNYNGESFTFNLLENRDFAFNNVSVTPKDGVGDALKWIFENIFSKAEVERYLRDEINKEVQRWVSQKQLITELEKSINSELLQLENLKIKINDIASVINLKFKKFEITSKDLAINLDLNFDRDNETVHSCASEVDLYSSNNIIGDGDVSISHSLIENILRNYTILEIHKDGAIVEPLFCFGYKTYDNQGNPLGIKESFKLFGSRLNLTYWVKPLSLPLLSYDPDQEIITATLKLKIKMIGKGFPKIKVKNDYLITQIKGRFKIVHRESLGIGLAFIDFNIKELLGKIKLKLIPLTPGIPIPKKKIIPELTAAITKQLKNDFKFSTLIEDETKLTDFIKLKLRKHDLTTSGHVIDYELSE